MTDGLSGDVGISIGTPVRVWRINISSMRRRGFLGDGRHRLTRFQSRDIKSGDGGVDSDNKGKPRVQENYSRPLKSMTTRFRNVGQLAASHQNIVLSHAPSPLFCNMPAITSLLLQRGSSVSAPSSPELCPRVSRSLTSRVGQQSSTLRLHPYLGSHFRHGLRYRHGGNVQAISRSFCR